MQKQMQILLEQIQYPEHQLFESDVISDVCFGPKNQGLTEKEA